MIYNKQWIVCTNDININQAMSCAHIAYTVL